jgi:hypothetical protein
MRKLVSNLWRLMEELTKHTLPVSFINESYSDVFEKTSPIIVKNNALMIENMALGTAGNAFGNVMSGSLRGIRYS